MLIYGAEAQKNFNYNVDELANEGFGSAINVDVKNNQKVTGNTGYFKGSRAVYDNSILLQFRFSFGKLVLSENAKVVISYVDSRGNLVSSETLLSEVETSGSAYLVSIESLDPADCRCDIQVSIVDNGETLVTVIDSLASYAARTNANVALAMVQYGDAARAYLAEKNNK